MHDPLLDSRRSFLKSMAAASAASTVAATAVADAVHELKPTVQPPNPAGPNDRIRIATIGMGIIGFIDTECALKVPGVELVAASDLYEGRRTHAKEVFGDKVQTYVDYREILARKDVDAVLICVPDHWHARMSIDAMKAGKAVYCEKPMVRDVEEGPAVIAAQKETKAVFQVGSQFASSIVYDKVKELINSGTVGKVHGIEARYNRNSDLGAWQYSIPTDASPETVDWDRFLGDAPKRPFDPVRFFRWRNYWDYGTAVAGDLFIHLLTGIHHATGAIGPTRISAMGGQRYWNDGRDVYDVIMGLLDYPDTDAHGSFTLSLVTDFEDGGGATTAFRFVGTEGVDQRQLQRAHRHARRYRKRPDQPGVEGLQLVQDVLERPAKGVHREVPGRASQLGGETWIEADGEIRRSPGLRRAVRPFRQLLHVDARRKARLRRRDLRLSRGRPGLALQRELPPQARDRLGPDRDESGVVAAFGRPCMH